MDTLLQALSRSGRFQVLSQLGAGGMGVVYRAWDRELGAEVAIKALLRGGRKAHLRLKREFRSLAGIHHPNLVRLYEFLQMEGVPLIVMELVSGTDILSHVAKARPSSRTPAGRDFGEERTLPEAEAQTWQYDEERLLASFWQLCQGLEVLHAHQKVHRDIKPSNVLVDEAGRVVILDFGLVREHSMEISEAGLSTTENALVGTIPYMAPEILTNPAVGPQADWYSCGVLLYQSLTGRYPFEGSPWQILMAKQSEPPKDPKQENPECLAELAELCQALLEPDPRRRANGQTIRATFERLGYGQGRTTIAAASTQEPISQELVGRDRELAFLMPAWARARMGKPQMVWIEGDSGVGKTALVRFFLRRVNRSEAPPPLTIYSRCHERETVPYKVFGMFADRVGSFLAHLDEEHRGRVLPADYDSLCHIFPTLALEERTFPRRDPAQVRAEAFRAFGALVIRIARTFGLVLALDDVQWADTESVQLLQALWKRLEEAEDCPCLLLVAHRTGVPNAALEPLRNELGSNGAAARLPLEPLEDEAVRQLIAQLTESTAERKESIESIVRESGGNPLLIKEMVQFLESQRGDWNNGIATEFRLRDALQKRTQALSDLAQKTLVTLCLAGRPVHQEVLAEACGEDWRSEQWRAALHELSSARLVQQVGFKKGDLVEAYHDRIREELAASLPERDQQAIQVALAKAFERAGGPYTEAAASHWQAVGELKRAKELYLAAARAASGNLAFRRAARLFGQAAELEESTSHAASILLEEAEALMNAGSSEKAARLCEQAKEQTEDEAVRLRATFLAADQYLSAGLVDKGLAWTEALLHRIGWKLPRSGWRLLGAFLWERMRLRFQGLDRDVGQEADIPSHERQVLDMLWTLGLHVSALDPVLGGYFHAGFFRRALELRDEEFLARAYLLEGAFIAARGLRFATKAAELFARADAIARRLGDPKLQGQLALGKGVALFCQGEWARAAEELRWALDTFQNKCFGVAAEMATAAVYLGFCLEFSGRYPEAAALLEKIQENETLAGNLLLTKGVHAGLNALWLARDEAETSLKLLEEALEGWPERHITLQHFKVVHGRCELLLYEGEAERAWKAVQEEFGFMRRGAQFRLIVLRTQYAKLRGRVALAVATKSTGKQRRRLLADAAKQAKALKAEGAPFALAWGRHLDAGVAYLSGAPPQVAADLYEMAAASLEASGASMYMLAARARAAALRGDERGWKEALDAMRAQGVAKPEKFLRVLSPGFTE